MNNNFTPKIKSNENNNNIEKNGDQHYEDEPKSPVNFIQTTLPLKPFKKRTFEKCTDNKNVVRNLLNSDISSEHGHDGSNMTNQDLMDKVVDKIFTKPEDFDRKEVKLMLFYCNDFPDLFLTSIYTNNITITR